MKFFITFLIILCPIFLKSQTSELDFYKKLDSLNTEMIHSQFKNDSLNKVIITKLEKSNYKKQKEIKHNRTKNTILGISFTIAIIVISFIQ